MNVAKLEYIRSFFNDVDARTSRLRQLIELDFVEEALILATCAIESMAALRYNKEYAGIKDFVRIIFDYSGHNAEFSKISWIYFYKEGKDSSAKNDPGKPISSYKEIKAALLELYGKECDSSREMDKESIIEYLKGKGLNLDWHNLEIRLDTFSYAAVLYDKYRSRGVHWGRIATKWGMDGEPIFNKSPDGEDIYYDGKILYFSKEIVLEVLTNITQKLRGECTNKGKFPHELD